MGAKEANLKSMLFGLGRSGQAKFPKLTRQDIYGSDCSDDIERTYRRLGGILDHAPVNARATWDMDFNGYAVELDEQLHFNRFRATTLEGAAYARLPAFPLADYQAYCRDRELECLAAGRYGGKWTNPSCERQFGISGARGELEGKGPARWKQRAFYDFLKDLTPLILGFPVVRLSIWDEITVSGQPTTVGRVLEENMQDAVGAITELISRRNLGSGA